MPWGGLDQRQFPRIQSNCDILIHNRFSVPLHAKTQNIGAGGVCVILDQELEKMSHVILRLTLKKETPPIECDGKVVWIVKSKEPRSGKISYDTGIEFTNLDPSNQEKVTSFIQHHSANASS